MWSAYSVPVRTRRVECELGAQTSHLQAGNVELEVPLLQREVPPMQLQFEIEVPLLKLEVPLLQLQA